MGRPHIENPKAQIIQIRVDKETLEKLDLCAKKHNTNRSEIVRQGIDKVYNELKK